MINKDFMKNLKLEAFSNAVVEFVQSGGHVGACQVSCSLGHKCRGQNCRTGVSPPFLRRQNLQQLLSQQLQRLRWPPILCPMQPLAWPAFQKQQTSLHHHMTALAAVLPVLALAIWGARRETTHQKRIYPRQTRTRDYYH